MTSLLPLNFFCNSVGENNLIRKTDYTEYYAKVKDVPKKLQPKASLNSLILPKKKGKPYTTSEKMTSAWFIL